MENWLGQSKSQALCLVPLLCQQAILRPLAVRLSNQLEIHLILLVFSCCFSCSPIWISGCPLSNVMWEQGKCVEGKGLTKESIHLGFLFTSTLYWLVIFLMEILLPSLKCRACPKFVFPSSFNFSIRTLQSSPPQKKTKTWLFCRRSFQ